MGGGLVGAGHEDSYALGIGKGDGLNLFYVQGLDGFKLDD